MKLNNDALAEKLYEYADLLEAMGDNPYKIKAYRKAARFIHAKKENIYALIQQGFDLVNLPNIGKGISYTIHFIIEKNHFPEVNVTSQKVNELIGIKGLGSKRIKILKEKHQIYTKKDLIHALDSGELKETFSKTLLEQIKNNKNGSVKSQPFLRLFHALHIINILITRVKQIKEVKLAVCCGDYRRKKETIESLVLLLQCSNVLKAFESFTKMPFIKYILSQNKQHLKGRLTAGIDIDVYSIPKKNWGTALIFYTGNQEHFSQLSQYAHNKGMELNDKGLFENEQCITSDEDSIYKKLGLSYIAPELREGQGEIEAAASNVLPQLITLKDIKGDLHSHTNETDGQETMETMVQAASQKGYEFVAITDHSKSLTITNGLDEKRLLRQIQHIDTLNARSNHILVLKSIEVDILEDGSLDLSNDVLKELDIVVCSIHSKFKLNETKQTERILRAIDNPYFHILGHATGRLIRSRPPYPIHLERILQALKDRSCFIELNAQPYRLDINDHYCKRAKEMQVKIAISSDAHSVRGFNFMQLGIYQARRGWLEKNDVINTRSWPDLKKLLRKP